MARSLARKRRPVYSWLTQSFRSEVRGILHKMVHVVHRSDLQHYKAILCYTTSAQEVGMCGATRAHCPTLPTFTPRSDYSGAVRLAHGDAVKPRWYGGRPTCTTRNAPMASTVRAAPDPSVSQALHTTKRWCVRSTGGVDCPCPEAQRVVTS